jgi:hypothetical protein
VQVTVTSTGSQILPQLPQLFRSPLRSAQVPEQLIWPAGQHVPLEQTWPALQAGPLPQWQPPPAQLSPAPQAWLQAPQWAVSILRLIQVPPQLVVPAAQHLPLLQVVWVRTGGRPPEAIGAQTCPHAPQLRLSACRSVQPPRQQPWPAAQALPQTPQLLGSLARSSQSPRQQTLPPGQSEPRLPQVHFPLTQLSPKGQAWLQPPQLAVSALRSRQAPPQLVWPAGQQIPLEQTWPGAQAAPPPQLQPVEAQVSPGPQVCPQTRQFWVVFSGVQSPLQQPWPVGHALPHWPQLLASVPRWVQRPLQQVGAGVGQQVGPTPATLQRSGCPAGAAGPHW